MDESWGNKSWNLNRSLTLLYLDAHNEKSASTKVVNNDYAVYPASYYRTIGGWDFEKTIDFCFIGENNANDLQKSNRLWVRKFADIHFSDKSYLQYIDAGDNYIPIGVYDFTKEKKVITREETCNFFDQEYFTILKKSKFTLCPAGDQPWSMGFYEAIMCKSIPIVKHQWECWRSSAESKLDYKFYLAEDKEFIYRDDWVEHNYKLFLKYHTLEHFHTKCLSKSCNYFVHTNIKNNDGLHCCYWCSQNRSHGELCERKEIDTKKGYVK